MRKEMRCGCVGLLLALVAGPLHAQSPESGIYSCVDGKGRRLTSDRPIPECLDREQKLHNPSGTVKATIGPSLTAAEREAIAAREREQAMLRERQAEEKRRERMLLMRYPTQAMHEKERNETLANIDKLRVAAVNYAQDLVRQREKLLEEMEFYKKDPDKAPALLRQQLEDNQLSQAIQARIIAIQDAEIDKINARFDEERAQLIRLWPPAPRGAEATGR